jgi:hypothetical protein
MRRRVEMRNGPLLAGAARSRLLMLVLMLMLVAVLMFRARDPRMWSLFGGDDVDVRLVETADNPPARPVPSAREPLRLALAGANPEVDAGPEKVDAVTQDAEKEDAEQGAPSETPPIDEAPPPDEDPEQQGALAEEMTAVADNTFNQPEEMFAYYRLLRWEMAQSAEQLQAKAIQNPRYGDFFQRPEFYRGKLVEFQLRVRRVLLHEDLEKDNLAGVDRVWELIGYNDTSGQNFYMCVTDKLPEKMSYGEKVVEDGRFVGFFFKLMRYEDQQGKNRAIPVFIGKFIWDPPIPQKATPEAQMREIYWVLVAAAVLGAFLVGRWAVRAMNPSTGRSSMRDDPSLQMLRRRRSMGKDSDEESIDIDSWLDQTENDVDDSEINPDDADESEEGRR